MKRRRILMLRYLKVCDEYYRDFGVVPPVLLQAVGRICTSAGTTLIFFETLHEKYKDLVPYFLEMIEIDDGDDDGDSGVLEHRSLTVPTAGQPLKKIKPDVPPPPEEVMFR